MVSYVITLQGGLSKNTRICPTSFEPSKHSLILNSIADVLFLLDKLTLLLIVFSIFT